MSKILKLFILIVLFGTVFHSHAKPSTEKSERKQIEDQTSKLFTQKRWKELDQLGNTYRKGLPNTSAGTVKLALYYSAFYSNKESGNINLFGRNINEWLKSNPQSVSAHMAKAISIRDQAFAIRGSGYANTVEQKTWPKFYNLIEQQRKYLIKHKEIAHIDPHWFVLMIEIARYQGKKDDHKMWLNEGVSKFPYYKNIYLAATISALPKWGGNVKEVNKVAQLALQKTKSKTGYAMYTYVWYNSLLFQNELLPELTNNQNFPWRNVKQGWEDRLALYPDNFIRNGYMASACLMRDSDIYYKQLTLLNGDFINSMWPKGLDNSKCFDFFTQEFNKKYKRQNKQ